MTESLEGEIRTLRSLFWSDRDPDGRGFAPLADAYRRAGDTKQALELLGDGMDRHPDFTPGHVVAARLYVEQGLFTEAEIAARRVLDLDPENVDALRLLVRALDEEGEAVEAAKVREQLATLEPEPSEDEMPSDDSSAVEEAVLSSAAFAPEEPEAQEDVVEFDPFTLGGVLDGEEEVFDFGALAPDEPEAVEEEVFDFGALAPDEPAPDEAAEQIQTRTMAELYVTQGLTDRAIDVYQHLVGAAPDDAGLRARLEELRAGDQETDVASGETGAHTPHPQAVEQAPEADESDDGEVETLARDLAASGDAEHEVDTPFAWAEEVSEEQGDVVDGPSIGRFFDDLLSYGHASEPEES